MRALLVAVMTLSAAGAARADDATHTLGYPGIPDHGGELPDRALRAELGGGVTFESLSLGPLTSAAVGAQVTAGLAYDRVALLALASTAVTAFPPEATPGPSVRDPMPVDHAPTWGSLRREMLLARVTVLDRRDLTLTKRTHRPIAVIRTTDWLELGVGREQDTVHATALPDREVGRSLLSLGVGFTSGDRDPDHHVAVSVGLRLLRAQSPDGTVDHELLASFGVAFGN